MRNFALFYITVFFVFSFNGITNAQVVTRPSLGMVSQACGSTSFNSFDLTFSFTPESALGSSNQFIAELSNGQGSFANPTVIFTSTPGSITSFPATVSFSLPTTTAGEAFLIRVKSTDPASISSSSKPFPAYYKIHDIDFTINNLIETAVYCSGGSYLLSIDTTNGFPGESPLQYSFLTYNWFKRIGETTSFVFVSEGETLSVNEPGTYYVETNYGSCTSDSESNRVTISEATSGSTSTINSSLGNPYCSADGLTVLSAISGNSYQWFKDGEEIIGETNQMYETDESAEYSVNIDLGSCMTNASINLETTGFTSSIDVDDVNNIDEDETFFATITTTANNPEFKWYLDDVMISDANTNSFEVKQIGSYKAVITQTTGCNASSEFSFLVRSAFPDVEKIPNLISPNADGQNDTWVIPQKYTSGTNTEVMILSAQGSIVFKTNNYQNNWPENQLNFKSINPIFYYIITKSSGKTRKGSITVVK